MRLAKGLLAAVLTISAITVLTSNAALAHVVVKPAEVPSGSFQTFTVGVPNEKNNPTVSLKLTIPDNLQYVSPTVKPGWIISTEQDGSGEDAKVKSITWSGGSIPAGQRDDFTFSAKVPDTDTALQWKAYQTYQDGEIVAWDQDPSGAKKGEEGKPFSVTKVAVKTTDGTPTVPAKTTDSTGRALGAAALVISLIALGAATRQPTSVSKNRKKH